MQVPAAAQAAASYLAGREAGLKGSLNTGLVRPVTIFQVKEPGIY